MEQINYEKLIPQEPIADVVGFARQNGAFESAYLIYRSERIYDPLKIGTVDSVKITCSSCGHTFYAEKIPAGSCRHSYAPAPFGWRNEEMSNSVIDGDQTLCPCCGREAKTVHIGSMRAYGGELVDDAWVTELSRLPVDGLTDRLVLTDWCIRRCINKQGVTRYEIWPYTAWVVEEKKVVRLMGYMRTLGGSISILHKWEQRKTFCDVYGSASMVYPWDKSLLEGTTAENCKLDLYQDADGKRLVAYLSLWRKRPAVENLLVQDCGYFLAELIDRERNSCYDYDGIPKLKDINWKEKRPAQMLGLNKEEFRHMRRMRWNVEDLERYRSVKTAGVPLTLPEDMQLLRSRPAYEINRILEEGTPGDFWRILRYLKKQKQPWNTLQDYWHMAHRLHRDLMDSLVRWPRSLTAAHDQVMAELKARENAALNEMFIKRAEELAYLSFELDGLLIRPCQTETELIREGKDLHHCVATYAKWHAEGKTAILFIRQAAEPDKPFFTLEFDEKTRTVRQNRGLRNCDRTPEVKAFENAWLSYVRRARPKERTKIA